MKYVLSTSTNSTKFQEHVSATEGGVKTVIKSVIVHGGTNLASSKSGFGELSHEEGSSIPLWTPAGVVTRVSDEDAKFLENHEVFKRGVAGGFYKILDADPGADHNKVKKLTGDMTDRDASAPLTTTTLKTKVKVSTAKPE